MEIARESEWAAAQWPNVLCPDDIVDGVWDQLTDERLETLLSADPEPRAAVIRGIAARVAAQEVADYEYYSGVVACSIPEVWRQLNQGVLAKDLQGLSGGHLDTFLDFHRAISRLPGYLSQKLSQTFFWGFEGVPGLARAVRALAEELNRKRGTQLVRRPMGL